MVFANIRGQATLPVRTGRRVDAERVILAVTVGAEGSAVVEAEGRALADLRVDPEAVGGVVAREAFDIEDVRQGVEIGTAEAGAAGALEVVCVFEPAAGRERASA